MPIAQNCHQALKHPVMTTHHDFNKSRGGGGGTNPRGDRTDHKGGGANAPS